MLRLVSIIICLITPTLSELRASTENLITPHRWQGEYFDQSMGGIWFHLYFKGMGPISHQKANIIITNLITKKSYLITQAHSDMKKSPSNIWKIPQGKYFIKKITLIDSKGQEREWRNKKRRRKFVVKKLHLSNLGAWLLTPKITKNPKKPLKIKVKFYNIPNKYKESSKGDSSVVAVINGFTALTQRVIGGESLKEKEKKLYTDDSELRASYKTTQTISMYYALDLMRHNRLANQVVPILNHNDPNIRSCYTDRLYEDPELSGTIEYKFIISSVSKSIVRLKPTGGTIRSSKMIECIYYQLKGLDFPVTDTMGGSITFTFKTVD